MRGSMSSSSRAALGPRSCSGDGDGSGRMDPLRGGGDSTVICCGERSGSGGSGGRYELREGSGGGSGNVKCDSITRPCPSPSLSSPVCSSSNSGAVLALGGAVATGVSPSR